MTRKGWSFSTVA